MADVKLKDLNPVTTPTASQSLLVFDESTNAGNRINYDLLADAILNKITTKNYTLDAGSQTLISALNALNSKTAWIAFNNTDILTQIDALPQGAYNGYFSASNTGNSSMPPVANNSWYIRVNKNSNNFTTVILEAISNAGNINFVKHKYNGEWDNEWTKYPTRTEMDELNSSFIYASSLDDLCTKILAMPTSRTAPLFTAATATSALINVNFIGKGYVSKVSNILADILLYSGGYGELYTVRINPTTKEITSGSLTSLPTRTEVNALSSKLGRLITSGSLHDILTPGIFYIGSSVTDQPVQQNGYGGTYIVSSANENTLVGTYISMYDKSIWSIAKLNAAWTYTQMAKHVALSPTLSGCGSGSSIHAVQIGTVVVVTAKIKYSGSNVSITGLPDYNGDTQNGFVVIARDQTDGSAARMWTNGAKNIMKIDNLTTEHMYGMSYTYIIA